jgi:hypothetical protein
VTRGPIESKKKRRTAPRIWKPKPYRKPPPNPPEAVRAVETDAIEAFVAAQKATKVPPAPARILGESSPGWRRKVEIKSTRTRNRYVAEQKRLAKRILPEPDAPLERWQRPRPSKPQTERPTLRKRSRAAPV